jgi:MFS transporter, SP family, arabinose:H+ symporter
MNKLFIWSFTVALAGLLFGFDTVVISGADQRLQELWESSNAFHGFIVMGMALWGTVIGAIFGGLPTNKFGRKNTLIGVGVLFLISALGSALVYDPYTFAFFRFIGGLGIGASTIAAPAYISEIAPSNKRGRLVAMYQLSIVVGILLAYISNYALKDMGDDGWRWMIGMEAIPAFIYCIIVLFVPKSPRWLVSEGRVAEASNVLQAINPGANIKALLERIAVGVSSKNESVFSKKYSTSVRLVFFIAFFNQLSGINAFLYFAPRIFEEAGLASSSALLSSAGIGVVNIAFTVLGMFLIDRYGRKHLLYIGSFGYIVSLGMVAASFFLDWGGLAVPVFLFIFIASHAIGQGTVIWVFIAELFPTNLRASGQAFGSSVHWILAALVSSFFPMLFAKINTGVVFSFFAFMMVLQLVWVHIKMPETKGIALEDINDNLKN